MNAFATTGLTVKRIIDVFGDSISWFKRLQAMKLSKTIKKIFFYFFLSPPTPLLSSPLHISFLYSVGMPSEFVQTIKYTFSPFFKTQCPGRTRILSEQIIIVFFSFPFDKQNTRKIINSIACS